MKVLVATNDLTFSVSLSEAYKRRGDDVDAGIPSVFLDLKKYDLIHFHWPEEFADFTLPPSDTALEKVTTRLRELRKNSRLVCTVHNLLPHGDGAGATHNFYNQFYALMDRVGHFSETSLSEVKRVFPDIPEDKHCVHGMNNFAHMRKFSCGPKEAREELGISPDALVVCVCGWVRNKEEMDLVFSAIDKSKAVAPKLLFYGRRPLPSSRVDRFISDYRFGRWAARNDVVTPNDGVPAFARITDSVLVRTLEASDGIFIPRMQGQLNSGLLPLAMTFGTRIVAPKTGVFEETLGQTGNLLYQPGNSTDAAAMITRLSEGRKSYDRTENLELAASWTWDKAIERLIEGMSFN